MPRDQKVLAHDPARPHEWAETTSIYVSGHYCHFCQKYCFGAHLSAGTKLRFSDICRACIRLALYRMAEIPEAQS